MSPIHIRAAASSDASAISQVHLKAQDQWNAFYAAMFTEHSRNSLMPFTTLALTHTDSFFLVATSADSRDILGFIRYIVVGPSTAPDSRKKSDRQILLEAHLPKPKVHLREIWNRFEDRREEEKEACYCNIHQGCRHNCMLKKVFSSSRLKRFELISESRCQPSHDRPKFSETGNR